MTQDELDRLPIVTEEDGALWQPERDEAFVIDPEGSRWMIGYLHGVRCKRKVAAF